MTRRPPYGNGAVVDAESPWKLTLRDINWPFYTYKMSASEWHRLLARAKRGDPESEWEVADRYGDGCKDNRGNILLRRSARRAGQWFRRAAEHGQSSAQNNLAVRLSNGDGIAKNVQEAFFWFKKAFRAGNVTAAQNIAVTYREIGNLRVAVRWFKKSAMAGDDDALLQLGIHYYWGKGVRKNSKAAVQCFRKATKAKNISGYGRDDAFFFLGLAYFEGRGVKKSARTARRLFQRANGDDDNAAARTMLRKLHDRF
ncbi:MAG: tetratricopeptide repeat protein [Terriglobales bacterium]